jgi:hypothetical protein
MKTYDVFVSYRWVEPDQTWVREQLVPALKSAGLKVCLDVEDFVPGSDLILEMNRAGTQSRKALCILSPDYFDGNRMVAFDLSGQVKTGHTWSLQNRPGDCQVLDNTHKSATSRVEHRVEKRPRIYSHILRMSRLARKFVTSEDAIRHECI